MGDRSLPWASGINHIALTCYEQPRADLNLEFLKQYSIEYLELVHFHCSKRPFIDEAIIGTWSTQHPTSAKLQDWDIDYNG